MMNVHKAGSGSGEPKTTATLLAGGSARLEETMHTEIRDYDCCMGCSNRKYSVAKSVRLSKEAHPEKYCPVANCLWRTETRDGFKPCAKHPHVEVVSLNLYVGSLEEELDNQEFLDGR